MAPEENHDSWKGVNVNVGLLVAMAALFCTAFLAGVGVPAWVDDRVDDRVNSRVKPLELRLDQQDAELDALRLRVDRLEEDE